MSDAKQFIVGGIPVSVKDEVARQSIGDLSELTTTNKSNIVAAINEAAQSGGSPDAVQYTQQSLTDAQKSQARMNIGAASSGDIPSVPVISTDISADAASDLKTASPKAVKTYVDAHSGSGTDPEAVKYTAQSLEDSQKTQARTNIGAQETLVGSGIGQNIKTINQNSLLGSGDLTIEDGEDGVGFESISTPATTDGTTTITLTNGDTITLDLNHQHPQYPKYVYCATQAAYDAITTKESDTLYLILESN